MGEGFPKVDGQEVACSRPLLSPGAEPAKAAVAGNFGGLGGGRGASSGDHGGGGASGGIRDTGCGGRGGGHSGFARVCRGFGGTQGGHLPQKTREFALY